MASVEAKSRDNEMNWRGFSSQSRWSSETDRLRGMPIFFVVALFIHAGCELCSSRLREAFRRCGDAPVRFQSGTARFHPDSHVHVRAALAWRWSGGSGSWLLRVKMRAVERIAAGAVASVEPEQGGVTRWHFSDVTVASGPGFAWRMWWPGLPSGTSRTFSDSSFEMWVRTFFFYSNDWWFVGLVGMVFALVCVRDPLHLRWIKLQILKRNLWFICFFNDVVNGIFALDIFLRQNSLEIPPFNRYFNVCPLT